MVKVISALIVALGVTGLALGDPVIDISGNLFAAYGDSDAWNRVFVTGGEPVEGLEFNIEIGGGTVGPIFETMPDIINDTIFAPSNEGYFPGSYYEDRWAYAGTVTDVALAETVPAAGLLATVRFIATGITNHTSYTVSLTNTPEGPTNFAGIDATITNGNLIVTDRGDKNGDYKVDIQDLAAVAANWSTISPGEKLWHEGNFNPGDSSENPTKDWVVDIIDLTALAANWTFPPGSAPPVPEPLTLSLLAAGAVVLLRRRR